MRWGPMRKDRAGVPVLMLLIPHYVIIMMMQDLQTILKLKNYLMRLILQPFKLPTTRYTCI